MIEDKKSLFNINLENIGSKNKNSSKEEGIHKISISQLKIPDYMLNSMITKKKVENYNIFDTKEPLTKKEISFKIDDQGSTNACGTTSLVSVLKFHGVKVKDHWEVDKSIRSTKFDFFTTPLDIVNYARDKGMNAGMKNNSSVEDIANYIDKGLPVMTLIDPGADKYDTALHWIVINGYERDDKGDISKLKISDPSGGYSYNEDISEFKKEWEKINIGTTSLPLIHKSATVSSGYKNLMVVISPKNGNLISPDGKPVQASSIKVPKDTDTAAGTTARIVAKGAILIDKISKKLF